MLLCGVCGNALGLSRPNKLYLHNVQHHGAAVGISRGRGCMATGLFCLHRLQNLQVGTVRVISLCSCEGNTTGMVTGQTGTEASRLVLRYVLTSLFIQLFPSQSTFSAYHHITLPAWKVNCFQPPAGTLRLMMR